VEYSWYFVIHFLYISLSASIYSKVPKQSRVVCRYLGTNRVVKNYLEKKIIFITVILFVFYGVNFDPIVLLT
jgi:hypothetical protein